MIKTQEEMKQGDEATNKSAVAFSLKGQLLTIDIKVEFFEFKTEGWPCLPRLRTLDVILSSHVRRSQSYSEGFSPGILQVSSLHS